MIAYLQQLLLLLLIGQLTSLHQHHAQLLIQVQCERAPDYASAPCAIVLPFRGIDFHTVGNHQNICMGNRAPRGPAAHSLVLSAEEQNRLWERLDELKSIAASSPIVLTEHSIKQLLSALEQRIRIEPPPPYEGPEPASMFMGFVLAWATWSIQYHLNPTLLVMLCRGLGP